MSYQTYLIAGGPRTGKSTFATTVGSQTGLLARSTDSLIGTMSFKESYKAVAEWFDFPGPWIVEGVAVAGALRHWLTYNSGAPCSKVYWIESAKVDLTDKQRTMTKGIQTVWSKVAARLKARGVEVYYL